MELTAVVTAFLLLEFFFFMGMVGKARGDYDVQAPAIAGHPVFERYFRVHQNTMEQLIVVLPCMWIFGSFISQPVAAGLGLLFGIGRIMYFRGYVADPAKRSIGFAIGGLATLVLVLGALIGPLLALL